MISVQNLSHTYGTGTQALNEVSVEFPRGTTSAVLGESGSGKTTLLMALGQYLPPQTGSITLDGQDIYAISEAEFRKSVGLVFQKLYLFPHMNVLENMVLAPSHVLGQSAPDARLDAMAMLERLGIAEVAESYPSQISGGQAQRVAIARGLMLRPQYMLLDEPTSALDANTTDAFAEWLGQLREETNFIIVTHDLPFAAQVAETGVYLSGGQILDAGRIDAIIAHVRAGQVVEA